MAKTKLKKEDSLFSSANIVAFFGILAIAFIVHMPTFSLALFGDDWLAFYRYEYHLGRWAEGTNNFFPLLFTVYGAQDITMGLLSEIFGYTALPYYILSFALRILASAGLYFLSIKITGKRIVGFMAALLFAISPTGLDATNWVFNMPSFVAIFFMSLFLYFFIMSREKGAEKGIIFSGVFYYLSVLSATIRMHLLPSVFLVLDLLWLIYERNIRTLKLVLARVAVLIFLLFLLKNSGGIMGSSGEFMGRIQNGINIIQSSVTEGDKSILLNPFVIIGRLLIPEGAWPAANKIFPTLLLRHLVFISLLAISPFIIYLLKITKKSKVKILLTILASIAIWTLVVKFFLPAHYSGRDSSFVGPALLGGYITIVGLAASYAANTKKASLYVLGTLAIVYLSFALPWIWYPNGVFATTHRYLITTSAGFALFIGALISLTDNESRAVYFTRAILAFYIVQSMVTYLFFADLVPVRGTKISDKVWGSMPEIEAVYSNEPLVFYYEGNSSVVYHLITFGLPPHIALLYDKPDNPPIPLSTKEEVLTAVTTGDNLPAYGLPAEPLSIESVYGFLIEENGNVIDISPMLRDEINSRL
jgi:hypothetical protein